MSRFGKFKTFVAATVGVVVLTTMAGVAPATAADGPVLPVADFETGSVPATLQQSGGPTITVIDLDGGKVAQIAGRTQDFDGLQTAPGALAAVQPGGTYTFSMRARLAPDTAGTASVRFVVKPGYAWVGANTMSDDGWTTVTGTWIAPATVPADLQVYIGTGALEGAGTPPSSYTYLVDDVTIVGPTSGGGGEDPQVPPGGATDPTTTPVSAAQGTGDVAALTFDDGPNGATTAALLDYLDANGIRAVFCVIGQNIQAAGGAELLRRMVAEGHVLCNHTTSYSDMGSWTPEQIRADLVANLSIIRTALGDPDAPVPFFRAPNGSWGQSPAVAVSLDMQPLAVTNTIGDWATQDVATLTANLRTAMKPGQLVLAHDGGGDRTGTLTAVRTVVSERLADGWRFTLPAGGPASSGDLSALSTGFEDGLDGWVAREAGASGHTVAASGDAAHEGAQSALVAGRDTQGDGIGHDVTGLLAAGSTYEFSAWIRFAPGQTPGDVWLSLQHATGGTTSFSTLAQFSGMSNSEWVRVGGQFSMPAAETAFLYLETAYQNGAAGNTSSFFIDDIVVREPQVSVQPLPPIKEALPFPIGVAIDARETTGAASELLLRHFDQITAENHMKPEAWYDANGAFSPHPQAGALMAFAAEHDLRVYGHTLVWHSQTPAWFFQDEKGEPLSNSAADQAVLEQRMRDHIFAVAQHLSDGYGAFGSDGNPLVAFDVVNEVVADGGEFEDGLRRSEWYRILGERYIDLAFQFADEAFNDVYAAEGADRPVTLFINDYNTEQGGKQARMVALVDRLLDRDVPVDGVGHQFHVSLATPVSALDAALDAFADRGLEQAVTELDVTTGTPVTEAKLIEQGYYYRDAFDVFREHADEMFSVTVWGLTDGRSWRASSGAPLVFDDALQAKPAYYGIVDSDDLPARIRTANVFRGFVPIDGDAAGSLEWRKLPLHPIEDVAAFQLRWEPDRLTAYVTVTDGSADAGDEVQFQIGDETFTIGRDGEGDAPAMATEQDGGYAIVAQLPLDGATEGHTLQFDIRVVNGGSTSGWNSTGATGTLTLLEPLSYTEVPEASVVPSIDGSIDAVWAEAGTGVTTEKEVQGPGGATALVRTLWSGDTLYVLMEVADPTIDVSASDPWQQDSVEIYVDAGNVKNGSYRYDDTQIRISATNVVSFGTGDEAFQRNRLDSATAATEGGYVIEAAISLLDAGGLDTFHGLDFQVNDATGGARTAIHNWADPSGTGYQSTARWGVGRLVAGWDDSVEPSLVLGVETVAPGGALPVELAGIRPGTVVQLGLSRGDGSGRIEPLGELTIGAGGTAEGTLSTPATVKPGQWTVVAEVDGDLIASDRVKVKAGKGHGGR